MTDYKRLTLHNLHCVFAWEPEHVNIELENKIEDGTLVVARCRIGYKFYLTRVDVNKAHSDPCIINKILTTNGVIKVKLSYNSLVETSEVYCESGKIDLITMMKWR